MDSYFDRSASSGGGARGGGSWYHLSFQLGSRSGGAFARGSFAYITRCDEYAGPDRDAALYTESEHMPSWAHDDPERFWDAADLYERANGRLFVSADFALPRDLQLDDRIALAREFAQALTEPERLPYTLAIHAGRDADGREHNPHAHLMFSERGNDGVGRSREQWFRQADTAHPERGGAPKSRTFRGRACIEQARERWASMTNATLERLGRAERVDHRSYARQGVDRAPGVYYGRWAPHVVSRGGEHEGLNAAAAFRDDQDAILALDQEITDLEAARAALLRDEWMLKEPEQDRQQPIDPQSSGGDRDKDDRSWGR
jgi:hypothetical protein